MNVVSQILEMLLHGIDNADFANGYTQLFHQIERIGISSVGGTESRHGYANDTSAVALQTVESMNGYQQCQRRIKSTTDTYNYSAGIGVFNASSQCRTLHTDYFFVAFVGSASFGFKGVSINRAG